MGGRRTLLNGVFLGAGRDLERVVRKHLFVVASNNSGSSFLAAALATSRTTWSLDREGWRALGFVGPQPADPLFCDQAGAFPALLWASEQRWIDLLTAPDNYDWRRTRRAWYFQAHARAADAPVFVAKWPPLVLCATQLRQHFPAPRFLLLVRNPYALCEGICRKYAHRSEHLRAQGKPLEHLAAKHAVRCLAWQRRNHDELGPLSLMFSYEAMCAEPERVAADIAGLVPELDDLVLRQRLAVKDGAYDELLNDMNTRQIERLTAGQIAAFNRVFREHRGLLEEFGYRVLA